MTLVSTGFGNWVGVNWQEPNTYSINRFKLYAPNDTGFGSTSYNFDASSDGVSWTNYYSGSLANSIGETVDITLSSATGEYQYYRVDFYGSSNRDIGISQFLMYAVGRQPTGG